MRFILFASLLAAAFAAKRYDGYKVFRVSPQDHDQLDNIAILSRSLAEYVDFWKPPRRVGSPVDMLVAPHHQARVLDLINQRSIDFEVTVDDLQKDIDAERVGISAGFSYEDFNTLADIQDWMTEFTNANPSLVSMVTVGTSYEGRTIQALKIGKPGTLKKIAWYEAGIHAREWISPATLIYMCKLLVEGYGVDTDVTAILDNLDVYMLPVYNVDGYEYTWTGDRMWRKTRSKNPSACMGADPNRNWDFQWGDESNWGCSDTYQGPQPHSEREVSDVTSYISSLGSRVKVFIDFHAYGLMWMTPWGYTYSLPPDYADQMAVVGDAMTALTAVHGTDYATGSIANTIYTASGSSADWAYGAAGIKYSFAVELRGNSFVINPIHIKPSGIETFEALKVTALAVL